MYKLATGRPPVTKQKFQQCVHLNMSRSESATDVLKVTLGEDLMLKQKIVDPPH